MSFSLQRRPLVPAGGGQGLRVGSARVDVTPALGVGLGGVGPTANSAQGAFGRLFANLLLIEDDAGTRVLLLTADLFAGSRYLCEALGIALADVGLTTDRILLAASHAHRAPSSLLGDGSFDRLAGPAWVRDPWEAHFDQPLADAMVARLEAGARAILGTPSRSSEVVTLRPAQLALTAPRLWGYSNNRSCSALDGVLTNEDPEAWLWRDPAALTDAEKRVLGERFSGSSVPAWLGGPVPAGEPAFVRGDLEPTPDRPVRIGSPMGAGSIPDMESIDDVLRGLLRKGDIAPALHLLGGRRGPRRPMRSGPLDEAVLDARLHLLVAREPGGLPIGAFGLFSATPTLLGGKHGIYTGDALGLAGMLARAQLSTPVPLGIGGGALGDVNLVPRGISMDDLRKDGGELEAAAAFIQDTGAAFAAAITDALEHASLSWIDSVTLHPTYLDADPVALGLDPQGRQSGTSLGGSELAGSPLAAILKEGLRSRPSTPPIQQSPKASVNQLQAPPAVWPLRAIRFTHAGEDWWSLLGLPQEVSTNLANELAVVVGRGRHPVSVASPCGGFAGYANTRWGYIAQAYEGSMNLHGRFTGDVLLRAFADGLPSAPLATDVAFSSTPGSLPLRLGKAARKPNALSANVRLHAARFKTFGRHRRPQLEVIDAEHGTLVVRAVVDGRHPHGPVWDGPRVAVGLVDAGRTRVDPFTMGTLPANDVNWPFLVWADVRKNTTHWRLQVRLPALAGRIGLVLHDPITGAGVRYLDADGWF